MLSISRLIQTATAMIALQSSGTDAEETTTVALYSMVGSLSVVLMKAPFHAAHHLQHIIWTDGGVYELLYLPDCKYRNTAYFEWHIRCVYFRVFACVCVFFCRTRFVTYDMIF